MTLLVLAFPSIDPKSYDWIQSYRKKNDELYFNTVDPHFTLVFPIDDIPEEQFIGEVKNNIPGIRRINFELTKAIVNEDGLKECFHEFLIPGRGYNEILALHEKMYDTNFRPYLKADIEYTPHITIGNSKDKTKSERSVAELNSKRISIAGTISELTVASYLKSKITNIVSFQLE